LRAIARRLIGSAQRKTFGPVQIDLTDKAVWRDGQSVELTAREWTILEALVLRTGRIVSRDDLEALVLGFDSELASNAIEVHIFKLRHKLGKALIDTVRGLGYRIPAT
jgi:two-component system OmpR family response regulator